MVLMPMGDQCQIGVVWQVPVREPVGGRSVRVDPRIGDDRRLRRLQDQARVVEVADPSAAVDVTVGGKVRRRGQQPAERDCLFVV